MSIFSRWGSTEKIASTTQPWAISYQQSNFKPPTSEITSKHTLAALFLRKPTWVFCCTSFLRFPPLRLLFSVLPFRCSTVPWSPRATLPINFHHVLWQDFFSTSPWARDWLWPQLDEHQSIPSSPLLVVLTCFTVPGSGPPMSNPFSNPFPSPHCSFS